MTIKERGWVTPNRREIQRAQIAVLEKLLPSSSIKIREWTVECLRIDAVSFISTKKVLSPINILSVAPRRVKSRSTRVISQASAGT